MWMKTCIENSSCSRVVVHRTKIEFSANNEKKSKLLSRVRAEREREKQRFGEFRDVLFCTHGGRAISTETSLCSSAVDQWAMDNRTHVYIIWLKLNDESKMRSLRQLFQLNKYGAFGDVRRTAIECARVCACVFLSVNCYFVCIFLYSVDIHL